ncbi:alginate O-acetyltransferase AlgX-related protein [Phaeovulum sp. W22_SRMD_FR3]|uniref:alginate O-acetyltransferase AlgX-related protein n=1 Tax=Phaeovulum sp. W22_SRMD_FR3 TaxID=3240274 RepID=UPI003F9C7CC0
MKLKAASLALAMGITAPLASVAQVSCPALADVSQYPADWTWLAPIEIARGGTRMLRKGDLEPLDRLSPDTVSMLAITVKSLRERFGTNLAMILTPPRGLPSTDFLAERTVRQSYLDLTGDIRSAGAIVPDLSTLVADASQPKFFFDTDTHWTPGAALRTALALRTTLEQVLTLTLPDFGSTYVLGDTKTFDIAGLIGARVAEICQVDVPVETVEYQAVVAAKGAEKVSEDDLFGDQVGGLGRVVLWGTSFSNKANEDRFRWEDSVQYALQQDVENWALDGGGVDIAARRFSAHGFDENPPSLILWEIPYTAFSEVPFRSTLREVQSAVQPDCTQSPYSFEVRQSFTPGEWVDGPVGMALQDRLEVEMPVLTKGSLEIELDFNAGQTETIKSRFSGRLLGDDASNTSSFYIGSAKTEGLMGNPGGMRMRFVDVGEPVEAVFRVCPTVAVLMH